jgi:RNA polymerase sigma-70 factor (ECF subfamily)
MGWLGAIFGGGWSDEEAMARVGKTGDPAAFAGLVKRWEGPIRGLCVRMAGAEAGENLAQEAFVRVFARRGQYDPGRKFSTWLWQIAVNLCREEWRRSVRRAEVELGERAGREPGPAEDAEARERATLVQEALAALPERLREVVILREYHGLTFREVAEVLGSAEGTVKWRMAEGLAALARRLGPRLGERPAAQRAAPAPAGRISDNRCDGGGR